MRIRNILVLWASILCFSSSACTSDSDPQEGDSNYPDSDAQLPDADDGARSPSPTNLVDGAEYLIITTEAMAAAYEELADWRRRTGLPARVLTMEEVLATQSGRDDAERLRNAIRDARDEWGTTIVLLGGDTPLVPHRDVLVYASVGDYFETSATAASELYFSDLDGTWDANENGRFGEWEDELDMTPDVAIGRVPSYDSTSAAGYVAKLIAYEQGVERDYQDRILLWSEPTGFYDISSCILLDMWEGQFLSTGFDVVKLYDDLANCPGAQLNTLESQRAALEDGVGIAIHLGHGSEGSLGYMDASQVDSLRSGDRQSVLISCACDSGNFAWQEDDSVGERFVLNPLGGGVAYVGNTDIGIGFPPGGFFVRAVTLALLRDNPLRIGEAFAEARTTFFANGGATWVDGSPDRYTQFVVVLLGDPALRVWRTIPKPIELSMPEMIAVDEQLSISISDSRGAAIEGVTVSLYQPGYLLELAITDATGEAHFDSVAARSGELLVTASGVDLLPVEAVLTVR